MAVYIQRADEETYKPVETYSASRLVYKFN